MAACSASEAARAFCPVCPASCRSLCPPLLKTALAAPFLGQQGPKNTQYLGLRTATGLRTNCQGGQQKGRQDVGSESVAAQVS